MLSLLFFLLAAGFCIYTYALFPLLLHLRAKRAPQNTWNDAQEQVGSHQSIADEAWPSVSVLIAAHNEMSNLPAKFDSLGKLDYPADKLQFVVVSDGSTDGSREWLAEQPDIEFDHYEPAAGKPAALNRAVQMSRGEYLVYMDARQSVSSNCIKALVGRFAESGVGAVSGELVLSDNGETESANIGLYWRYEKWIRLNESKLYSTSGATGALYCIRREDATPLPTDTLLDDFVTPVEILRKGKRTVFEPAARVFDRAEQDSGREFVRKVRTLAGNFQSFSRHKWLFSPRQNPIWWQFLSHKVARLMVPYAMLVAFVASAAGDGAFLQSMFWLQVLFYLAGLAGFLIPKTAENKFVNFIKVFLQLNAAAVVGAYRHYTGQANIRWKAEA